MDKFKNNNNNKLQTFTLKNTKHFFFVERNQLKDI